MVVARRIFIAILSRFSICLAITLLHVRILVWQQSVAPGEEYIIESWGDVGNESQRSLVCRYFTGHGCTTRVYGYDSGNLLGKDSCPFILRE